MASDLISSKIPAPTAPESSLPAPQRAAAAPKAPSKSSFADELARSGASDAKNDVKRDARDAAASAEDGRKDLRPLRKAALKAKDAVDSNPALAFLTGHLERLQPAQIPELVTTNEFLTDAMSEADLSAFMNKTAPLAELMQDLGLPESLLQEANALGMDLNQMISPNELLKALGVDAQRVFAELKVLKDTAAVSGFAPYLMRAKAAGAKGAGETGRAEALPGDAKDKNRTAEQLAAAGAAGASLTGLQPRPTLPPTPATEQPTIPPVKAPMKIGSAPSMLGSPPAMPGSAMSFAARQDLGVLDVTELSPDAMATLMSQAEPTDLTDALAEADPDLLQSAMPESVTKGPSMHRATHDAFAWMGERMKASDVSTVTLASELPADGLPKLAEPSSTEDLLQALRMQGPNAGNQSISQQLTLSAISAENRLAQMAMPQVVTAEAAASSEQLVKDVKSGDAPVLSYAQMFERDQKTALSSQLTPKRETSVPLAELMMARTVPVEELHFGSFKGGEQGFMGSGEEKLPNDEAQSVSFAATDDVTARFSEALTQNVPSSAAHGATQPALTAKTEDPTAVTPEQRVQLMQQVLDRATVMMKDGNSTMRLDFATPELGNLELAMKMNEENKLEMRIMTGSDRAREIMAAELGQLRSALAVQNIQLGNVEVGVGGRDPNAFAGFTGQQQKQQQNAQEQAQRLFQADSLRPLERAVDVAKPGRLAPLVGMADALAPGRITLRV